MRHLSKKETRELLLCASKESLRNHLMILVAYRHGLGASELISLRVSDVRGGEIAIRRLKGSLKTIQPLGTSTDPLFDETTVLDKYIAEIGVSGKDLLFPVTRMQFWRIMQKHGEQAGIATDKLHPHILKHSIAMHAMDNEVGIHNLKQYLGHKSMNSTAAYLRVDDAAASKAVGAAIGL